MGLGVRKDYLQSYVWFQLALDDCDHGAQKQQCKDYVASVASALTPDQMKEAQRIINYKKQDIALAARDLTLESDISW